MSPNLDEQTIATLHLRAGPFVPRNELLTIDATAEQLGCSRRTIIYWQKAQKMPPRLRRGRSFFYRAEDIARMLELRGQ